MVGIKVMWNQFREFWYNKIQGKQFIPNEEDVKEAKKLAERLKGKDDVETLNNILEWQERNILYWRERGYLDISLFPFIWLGYIIVFAIISTPIFVFLYILLTKFLIISTTLSIWISLSLTILIFVWIIFKTNTTFKLVYLLLWSYPIYELVKLELLKNLTVENISKVLNITVLNWAIFGISFFSLIYLVMIYKYFSRSEKSILNKIYKIWKLITATFKLSLTTSEILEYKMAICKDYAKLTASLLLNLYPNSKIFFFTFPGHVATGIEINGKIYILDQKLPIMNETAWLIQWNRKDATKLEVKRKNGKYFVEYIGKVFLKENLKIQDSKNLIKDLIKKIEKAIKLGKRKVVYTLEGKAKIYDVEDEIIEESLLRKIRLFLENEMVSNFSKIKELKIEKDNDDILLEIYLNH